MSELLPESAINFPAIKRTGMGCLLLCIFLTVLNLFSWLNRDALPIILPGRFIAMPPITAFAFIILAGIVYLMLRTKESKAVVFISNLLSGFIGVVIIIKLYQFFANINWALEAEMLHADSKVYQIIMGRMAPVTALSFLITIFTLFLINQHKERLIKVAGYLVMLSIGINVVVSIGYLFRTPLLYSYIVHGNHIVPVALPTAICFILIGVAIIAKIGAACFPLKPLVGNSTKARLLRAFVPLIFGFVLLDGIAYSFLPSYKHFNPALIPAIMALLFIGTASIVIYRVANKIGSAIDNAEMERKNSEEDLRESEERFRTLTNANFEGIIIHEKGIILDGNLAFAEMFGYDLKEIIGTSVQRYAAPESHEMITQNIKSGYSQPYPAIGLRKDGSTFNGELIGKVLPYKKRLVRVTSVRDISFSTKAEENLRESEQRYRLMFENNPAPMWVYSVENLRFLDVNNALIQYYGYSKSEFLGMTIQDLHADEDAAMAILFNKMSKNTEGINLTGEWKLKSKEGKISYAEIVSHAFIFNNENAKLVIANDITDRKRAEERILQSEKRFRALVERSSDVYLIVNQKGHIAYTAPSTLQILGYQLNEYISSNSFDYIHPEDMAAAKMLFSDLLQTPAVPFRSVYRTKHKKGQWLWMESVSINLLDDPNVKGILVNARDITDKKRFEHEASLVQEISGIIRVSETLGEALKTTLEKICLFGGLKLGEAWIRSNNLQQPFTRIACWSDNDAKITRFAEHSGNFIISENSIIAKVWNSGRSSSIGNLAQGINFERKDLLGTAGVRSGMFFPVLSNNKVVAVLDFFTEEFSEEDKKMQVTITTIATQLGLEINRKSIADRLKFQATILQHIGDGVITTDLNGIIIYWNQGASNLYGYTEEEALGKQLSIIYPEKHKQHVPAEIDFVIREGSFSGVRKLVHKNGEERYIEIKITPFKNGSDQIVGLIGFQKDITERIRAEAALKLSEERFAKVFATSPIGISITTLKENVYVDVNDAFVKMTSLKREEILGKKLHEIPAFKEYTNAVASRMNHVEQLKENGISITPELKLVSEQHKTRYMQVYSQLMEVEGEACSLTMINDITDLRESQLKLMASESRFQKLFEQAPIAIVIFRAGAIEFVNKACLELFEYSTMEELKNFPFTSLFDLETRTFLSERLEKNANPEGFFASYELMGVKKDGSIFSSNINIATIELPDGKANISYILDNTDRAEAMLLLEASQVSMTALISNLPGMVYRCKNDENWTMEFVSEGSLALTGYSPSDFMIDRKITYNDIIHPDDQTRIWEEVQDALKRNSPFVLKYRIITASGAVKNVWEQGASLILLDGRLVLEGFITEMHP
jgi:PAS domain S-box-containing protein